MTFVSALIFGDLKMATDRELLQQAFQALLRGDTDTRDKICDRLIRRNKAREKENIKLAMEAKQHFTEH